MAETLRLYLETTVFNYFFDVDREGHEDVRALMAAIEAGRYEGYASNYVVDELKRAPEPKCQDMMDLIDRYRITMLRGNNKVRRLANLYITEKALPASHFYDSMHLAAAAVHHMDCVISYNFRHINRLKAKRLTAKINLSEGYDNVVICTAKEVLSDE